MCARIGQGGPQTWIGPIIFRPSFRRRQLVPSMGYVALWCYGPTVGPRVLVVAGSDSSGGAGIQADIKTVTALGGYAATAVTALTCQNTTSIRRIVGVDPLLVDLQMRSMLDDIGADAIKIGMLHSEQTVELVARVCESSARGIPIVLDPVVRSSSGVALLSPEGVEALRERLLPLAAVVTPNADEAEALTGVAVRAPDDMLHALDRFQLMGVSAALVTGGHLEGDQVVDILRTADGEQYRFEHDRLDTRCTHGTGCTLSTAIACGLGEGQTLRGAVEQARAFVLDAMRSAVPLGSGRSPLDHSFRFRRGDPCTES